MDVDLFDFDLPQERIALRPAEPRDSARLLVVETPRSLEDKRVRDLPGCLKQGDVLVFNDTKVIPAQLYGWRTRGTTRVKIAVTLHKRLDATRWRAFARPAKRLKVDDAITFNNNDLSILFEALIEDREGAEIILRFNLGGAELDAAIAQYGHVPLPPYIAAQRPDDNRDISDYQTMFAKHPGAVAAPTAGLHFTPDLITRLPESGIGCHCVTLHVGAGTFLPIKVSDTRDHHMHAESGTISRETADDLNAVRAAGGRIIAVGTTALRLLESAAEEDGRVVPFHGDTSIFITPGYRFRAVDALLTNFHLPRSTLFMLVSAFSGLDRMRDAYQHAIDADYRFYSYGDACLLFLEPVP